MAENPAKLLESSRVSIGQPIEELDTPTILAELGFTADEIAHLRYEGVVAWEDADGE